MLTVYIDADACPVKEEVYRVAKRYGLEVILVANSWMKIPDEPKITLETVGAAPDAADDWIAEHAEADDIVITADIPLASRCMKNEVRVIGTSGKLFTARNIGGILATRDLMTGLRDAGEMTSGPPPITQHDRSRFLQQLDQTVQAIRRKCRATGPAAL